MRIVERILNPSQPNSAYAARLRYDAVNLRIKGSEEQASDDMGVVRRLLGPHSEPLRMGSAKTPSKDNTKLATKLKMGDRIAFLDGSISEIIDKRYRYKSVILTLRDVKDGTVGQITTSKDGSFTTV